jgi:hypothetical protein
VPYGNAHKLLTIHGDLFSSVEQWSIGIRFNSPIVPTQAMADAAAVPVKLWWQSSGFYSGHRLVGIKLAPIGVDGKYPPGTDSVESFVGMPVAGGSSSGAPQVPQAALVMSLTTALPRGRGHIGRVYLPAPNFGLTATGGLTPANATALLTPFKNMINSLNAITDMGFAAVFSRLGPVWNVGGLRMGLVYDTQRRRRRQIPEQPVSMPLA